jgi:UDP-N-acetylmuramyl tripeptide synthase
MVALAGGKLTAAVSRRLGGGGTALPGLLVEQIDPGLLHRIATQLGHGSVVVTGTNGKTTTARMLAAVAQAAGLRVIHNRSGSNLMRGLATTAADAAGVLGEVDRAADSIGVFEVDEATLPLAVAALEPRVVVFTNLFRDQLDRYGEVDSISALWRRGLERLPGSATVVLNADDPSVAALGEAWTGRRLIYGVDDRRHAVEAEHAADSRWCPACGAEYQYEALYFGHVGLWHCPGCGRRRPQPDVRGLEVELDPNRPSRVRLSMPAGSLDLSLPLAGLYNVYNALAAAAGALACEMPVHAVVTAIEHAKAAFGRQERMRLRGREVRLLLCKNPAGANQVLRLIAAEPGEKYLLLVLNDGIADGHDISWIWDVDFELLSGRVERAVISGRRADDMALRLKYAGLADALAVERDVGLAVERAIATTPEGATLSVLPTYTAMLEVRELLAHLAGRAHFWEE